jgi:hypothetical protein
MRRVLSAVQVKKKSDLALQAKGCVPSLSDKKVPQDFQVKKSALNLQVKNSSAAPQVKIQISASGTKCKMNATSSSRKTSSDVSSVNGGVVLVSATGSTYFTVSKILPAIELKMSITSSLGKGVCY